MTTYLGKSCSFCLPRVPFVNCRQFMYLFPFWFWGQDMGSDCISSWSLLIFLLFMLQCTSWSLIPHFQPFRFGSSEVIFGSKLLPNLLKPRLHDRTSCTQLVIWNLLFHIPCRATWYNLIYISLKIPIFHWAMQTCWHSLIWVKVKQELVMFSADSGVVWPVQCFALLKFIIPFVFLISCSLWEMIQHNWNNL